uniref:Uncharacterized protein n=1 Tax=Arundo donax TaxID=35708 RepID=A0A0A8Z624_ARUDO
MQSHKIVHSFLFVKIVGEKVFE